MHSPMQATLVMVALLNGISTSSLRAQRSNPSCRAKEEWIASSRSLSSGRPKGRTRWLLPMTTRRSSGHELATEFILDVNPDDVVEGLFGSREAEFQRPLRLEIARPAGDDAHDERIRLAPDARGDLVARHPLQRGDLFADRRRQAGHGEVAARADHRGIEGRGMQQE